METLDKIISIIENLADQDWYTEEQKLKSEELWQMAYYLRTYKETLNSIEELVDENKKLKEKYKKAKKEKKRWKRKYLGLRAEIEPLDFSAPKKVVGEEEIKITW